jgi:hypothetical protein
MHQAAPHICWSLVLGHQGSDFCVKEIDFNYVDSNSASRGGGIRTFSFSFCNQQSDTSYMEYNNISLCCNE